MAQGLSSVIEFVGGPFDGHLEMFPAAAEQLPQDLIWLVTGNVYRLLDGESAGPKQPVTSIALYERRYRRAAWRYEFTGVISPRELCKVCAEGDFRFLSW
jgi:hypothetical protein